MFLGIDWLMNGSVGFNNWTEFIWKYVYGKGGILNWWAFGGKNSLASESIIWTPALLPNYLITCKTDVDMRDILITNVSNL